MNFISLLLNTVAILSLLRIPNPPPHISILLGLNIIGAICNIGVLVDRGR